MTAETTREAESKEEHTGCDLLTPASRSESVFGVHAGCPTSCPHRELRKHRSCRPGPAGTVCEACWRPRDDGPSAQEPPASRGPALVSAVSIPGCALGRLSFLACHKRALRNISSSYQISIPKSPCSAAESSCLTVSIK